MKFSGYESLNKTLDMCSIVFIGYPSIIHLGFFIMYNFLIVLTSI